MYDEAPNHVRVYVRFGPDMLQPDALCVSVTMSSEGTKKMLFGSK
jgi:hypothetical protein